jgi:glutaredoxin
MVRIYTIDGCPYCEEIKEKLTNENIEFLSVPVDKPENEAEYKAIHEITKSDDVPLIRVGKRLLVPHVSFLSIDEAVQLVKNFVNETETK